MAMNNTESKAYGQQLANLWFDACVSFGYDVSVRDFCEIILRRGKP
jgi:hypothetical protein